MRSTDRPAVSWTGLTHRKAGLCLRVPFSFLYLAALMILPPTEGAKAQSDPAELQLAFDPSLENRDEDFLTAQAYFGSQGEEEPAEYDVGEGLNVFLNRESPGNRSGSHFFRSSAFSGYAPARGPEDSSVSAFIGTRKTPYGAERTLPPHYVTAGPYDNYYAGVAGLGILLDPGIWASFAYGTGDELPGLSYENDIEGVAFDESERLLFGLHFYY